MLIDSLWVVGADATHKHVDNLVQTVNGIINQSVQMSGLLTSHKTQLSLEKAVSMASLWMWKKAWSLFQSKKSA